MDINSTESVIADVFKLSRGEIGSLPPLEIGLGLDEGLRVQIAVMERWAQAGEHIGGWKVGLTSGPGRDSMGIGFRPFGYVLASRIFKSGDHIARSRIGICQIEPEICLTLGSRLFGGDVSAHDALCAVTAISPAFEINEVRLPPGSLPGLALADDLGQWGIVIGPESLAADRQLTGTTVELLHEGNQILSVTPGGAMDDPYLSLARLAGTLHRFGLSLLPGQKVITGSFCNQAVQGSGEWRARFSEIGDVSVAFD